MKISKIFQLRLLTVLLCFSAAIPSVWSQANFSVIPVEVEGDITPDAAKVIFRKTEQILTRNSAGAAGVCDVFAVRAKLTVGEKLKSSGMVRDITSLSGELTLTAINKVDDAKYYSVTVPLQAAVKGSEETGAVLALANSIKPTDAVFTRFVRLAREKIEEYYSDHCSEVIGRASSLAMSGQYAVAMVYLTGMPASAPCHEEALELIAGLRTKIDSDMAEAEAKKEAKEEKLRAEREKRRDERRKSNRDDADDDDYDEEDDDGSESADGSLGELYVESPNWEFKVESAEYFPTSRKIKITAFVKYVGRKSLSGDCSLGFRKAIDANGEGYDKCYVYGDTYRTFPTDVPVKIEYFIDDVTSNPKRLSFVGLTIDYKKIEIRNLPISK